MVSVSVWEGIAYGKAGWVSRLQIQFDKKLTACIRNYHYLKSGRYMRERSRMPKMNPPNNVPKDDRGEKDSGDVSSKITRLRVNERV